MKGGLGFKEKRLKRKEGELDLGLSGDSWGCWFWLNFSKEKER